MGILLCCKELLDKKEAPNLRSALDLVLRHNGKSMVPRKSLIYSKWFLEPFREFQLCKLSQSNKDDMAFNQRMQFWINKGNEHFKTQFPTCCEKNMEL